MICYISIIFIIFIYIQLYSIHFSSIKLYSISFLSIQLYLFPCNSFQLKLFLPTLGSSGGSNCTIQSTCGMSKPRAATSVHSRMPSDALQNWKKVVVRLVCFCLPYITKYIKMYNKPTKTTSLCNVHVSKWPASQCSWTAHDDI